MIKVDPDFSRYKDIPWRPGDPENGIGRFTCWTLFRRVYWDKLCIDLPAYDEIDPNNKLRVAKAISSDLHQWYPIRAGQERVMDGVMMYGGTHVGLVVRRGLMLHVERDGRSLIEHYNGPRWETCIDGFYRYGADPAP